MANVAGNSLHKLCRFSPLSYPLTSSKDKMITEDMIYHFLSQISYPEMTVINKKPFFLSFIISTRRKITMSSPYDPVSLPFRRSRLLIIPLSSLLLPPA